MLVMQNLQDQTSSTIQTCNSKHWVVILKFIGKFIGSNLVFFCYKEFEKFVLCKSVSQSETTYIVYSEPIESGHVKITFS